MPASMRAAGRRRQAFTLIEILVVVAIIALLAVVAMVQINRARITTHEQLALSNVRLVAKSSQFYFLVNHEYPIQLSDLGPPKSDPPSLEEALREGNPPGSPPVKQGYRYTYASPAPYRTFTLQADPVNPGVTGVRHFYTDETFVMHASDTGPAGVGDPVIP